MSSNNGILKVTGITKLLVSIFLLTITAVWIFPMASALFNSMKFFGLKNYAYVLSSKMNGIYFIQALLNSFIIAGIAVFLTTSVSALAGFCFSKIDFPFRNVLYITTLSLLSIPGVTILIPLFFTLKKIGLNNTFFAVALPQVALTLPFGVLLMRNAFDAIHNDYMAAASIDGANIFQVFWKIYLPLNAPAAINLAILQFVWSFQDFLLPSFMLSKRRLMTATQMISSFNRTQTISPKDIGGYNAGIVLLAIPVIIIFIIFSGYIKRGLTSGGLKG
ncbi:MULTISPECIES: carbohydrate ABC transporter permease [unclassified Oceanispirochaeta]|uniref:carbohydrate ABC transporter permease n=1 Tax=unclassified Oceanispirochaeta TaxID=2635722 RepID=UPI000E09080C|nr:MULTISPECIES: carbohydrate ABC transporter permease [unclassified Oceanispirochaeta]MBF9014996.1 carbohydrate ABC transporter permease [Oceanispirochaeta sp. M2]NPD71323.1 carbohydrate ABC transporter permease [Oceanispirochaeta sp. M1]RDG33289.1 carbohydrate ABC transporter permease [Oceanispirochaeta sp. M1]